ncbi:hypothetical protein AMATHDRAFT_3462 [Amanita thiersii Skay4041]|uniref:Yeast cell wall synthesis Kre9/Knh1-like N-terminal domain-containing protein n=1 Tax=Amanita thiersii Skay4041 TaxID=703135 RepID=A0A2A9NRQ5_9AGAR|nr:hypothetical protein AMATHDRAFT_3462 [Amanita thiersii Skay4041]
MLSKLAFTALLATFSAFFVNAEVIPSEPGPGAVYKEGGKCHISWQGDKSSPTIWKDMSIQLMTGSNFEMVHLTTVASHQDGTASGSFDYDCPNVTPNSAIYFYQFTSPLATDKQWTTRFTIASATGSTTPPDNAVQPGTGEQIPWGTGALDNASTAVPPPDYLSGNSSVTSASANISTTSSASLSTTTSASISSTTDSGDVVTVHTTVQPSSTGASSANATATGGTQNGALSFPVEGQMAKIIVGSSLLVLSSLLLL